MRLYTFLCFICTVLPASAADVRVGITEWKLPSRSTIPHNIVIDPQGNIWYSSRNGVVGRFEPQTGRFREHRVPDSGGGIHGLALDDQGNVWYGIPGSPGGIGTLNPVTGKTRIVRPRNGRSSWVGALTFDYQGDVWFSLSDAHSLGRLANDKLSFGTTATLPANFPVFANWLDDIATNSRGALLFIDFHAVGLVDPVTADVQKFSLPSIVHPLRFTVTPDDVLWYTNYYRSSFGSFNPVTTHLTEWAAPGGSNSNPYAIVHIGNTLWFVQSGTKPKSIVRFDPGEKRFQSWDLPSCKGEIYHAASTLSGDIWFACSRANSLIRVRVVQ